MIKKTPFFIGFVFLLFIFEIFIFSSKIRKTLNVKSHNQHKIQDFELDHNFNFCNERVPLYSQDILERFEKEILKNAHWRTEIIMSYKRSGKYFPVIEKILSKNGIPNDFKYLPVVESGLDNVTSRSGAAGFWQFMRHTGQEYGLEINEHIDERYDLAKSTKAACKYFKEAHKKFKSWTLVAASFNIGINGLKKRLKNQQSDNYYDLHLNSESSRYVFRVVAVKDILSNPANYNYRLKPHQKYSPIRTKKIKIDYTIENWTDWAVKEKINIKILKIFNPWIRSNELPNDSKKAYFIEIPVEHIYTFTEEVRINENENTEIKNPNLIDEK